MHETLVQRAVREAVRQAGIAKHAGCHTLNLGGHGVRSPLDGG